MTFFTSILRHLGIGNVSAQDTGSQNGTARTTTDAGITVSDERAMQVSAVWACVQYITNSVCSLPLNFYRKLPNGGRKQLDDHSLNALFDRSPNSLMKPRDFRKAMTMQLCLWSNAYAEITWLGDRPVSIVPLRPGRMTPFIGEGGVLTYHYQMEQGVRVYSQRSIMHMKGFGADGVVGMERNNYARPTLGLSVSADVYAAKQFANGGRSGGGYLMFDEFLNDEQRKQARDLYAGMSETAYDKGKLWILEGGVKYETDALNPDTMQMIETRKMQLGEIARFFGVPEVLIGASGATSAWPASFEQQLLSFLTFTLQDYIDEWECSIHDSLLTDKDKRKVLVDHDVEGFIKMDSKTRAEVQSIQTQNGIKTRNEVRLKNNDDAKDGGDDLTVQVNLTPLEKLGETPEPPPEPVVEDSTETDELRRRVIELETKQEMSFKPEDLKAEPQTINISVPEGRTPVVNVQNDVHVPPAKQPIVNVKNDVKTPSVVNEVKSPDVKVTVPVPEVKVENTVNVQEKDKKPRKVTFEHDKSGKTTGAVLEDG